MASGFNMHHRHATTCCMYGVDGDKMVVALIVEITRRVAFWGPAGHGRDDWTTGQGSEFIEPHLMLSLIRTHRQDSIGSMTGYHVFQHPAMCCMINWNAILPPRRENA
jgi:hypothetical protein